jgi:hypothetical protein
MKFSLMICRRGMKMWARRPEWPFRIVGKRESLRKFVPRRRQLQHRKREWRKVVDAARTVTLNGGRRYGKVDAARSAAITQGDA